MGKLCWDFPPLGTGNENGSKTAAITMFRGTGSSYMDGLIREVCQNSLDAKNKKLGNKLPVRVVFSEVSISRRKYPEVFDEFEEYVDAADRYWRRKKDVPEDLYEFLDEVKSCLKQESLSLFVMSDYNTTGLNGVNAAEEDESYWNRLVNSEGISYKQDKDSAGSYGVGKNAPFGYSNMNMVFYNTLAEDGSIGFEGVSRLVTTTRQIDGVERRTVAIGKYLYLLNMWDGRAIVPGDNCRFANEEVFKRENTQYGTDVAIVGFKKELFNEGKWEKEALVAAIKNFVLAIMEGKLEVEIKSVDTNYLVNQDSLKEMLFDQLKDSSDLINARQIYETLDSPDLHRDYSLFDEQDLSIYVKYKETYRQSLSKFRTNGMLVCSQPAGSRPHFSVVEIVNAVGNETLTSIIKDSEPPQHTEWKSTNANNKERANEIKAALRMISTRANECIEECDEIEVDEIIDAGVGAFLPDTAFETDARVGSDGLRQDVKISEVRDKEGRIIYSATIKRGESATGELEPKNVYQRGDRKHKKREKKKIDAVDPSKGGMTEGVSLGQGKLEVEIKEIVEHRTYLLAQNKYRLFVKSPENYENVILRYRVGRDDGNDEGIVIKSLKMKGTPLLRVDSEKAGPIALMKGNNEMIIEFEEAGRKVLTAKFLMEVQHEK